MATVARHILPLLELDVLKTFVAIAETGNFTTAAETVFRTPSAVSMQVKKLEEMLGGVVFLRDARSVTLTSKGELLLGYARRMLALNNEAISRFLQPDMNGIVRVGAPEDIGERILPGVLRRFSETYPNVTVDVMIGISGIMRKRVEDHRMDIVIFNTDTDEPRPNSEILLEERITWAGTRSGTAHLRQPLPVSMWEDGCIWRKDALEQLQRARKPYRVAFQSAHGTGQKAAILADLAVAPLARYLVHGDLVELGEADGLPPLGSYFIGLQMIEDASPPVQAVADYVKAAFLELSRKERPEVRRPMLVAASA